MGFEPQESAIEVAGGSLRYLQAGAGPTLLVLHHDIGPSGWTPFHDALASGFRVIAPDIPGFGLSTRAEWARHPRDLAALLLAFTRRLGLEHYTLAGLGFGGWVAAEMAAYAPGPLDALILASPAGLKPDAEDILDQIMMDPYEYARAGFADDETADRFYPRDAFKEHRDRLDAHREAIARVTWKPYMYSYELPEILREMQAPATVAWGTANRVIPPACASRWAALLPDCRVRLLDGGGHFLDLERPDELARIVREAHSAAREA